MKSTFLPAGALLAIFTLAALSASGVPGAEEPGQTPASEQPAGDPAFAKLPPPLDGVSGNALDLEQSGHFQIVRAQIGRTKLFQDEALIWTIKVVRPIACRHAQLLFLRATDVRFYRIEKDGRWRRQLLATRLCYPQWIDSGAANRESLSLDEEFQIWIPLSAAEVDRLQHQKANKVVFSHPDRRTIVETKERKQYFGSPPARY